MLKIFESKINGDLTEEFKSLSEYKKDVEKKLRRTLRRSKIVWASITLTIALLNLTLIAIASYILNRDINDGITIESAPTIALASLTILSFVVTIAVSIYQGLMRAKVYGKASEFIQAETLRWTRKEGIYKNDDRDKLFEKRINFIIKETKQVKHKVSVKKTLAKILTGGTYE